MDTPLILVGTEPDFWTLAALGFCVVGPLRSAHDDEVLNLAAHVADTFGGRITLVFDRMDAWSVRQRLIERNLVVSSTSLTEVLTRAA